MVVTAPRVGEGVGVELVHDIDRRAREVRSDPLQHWPGAALDVIWHDQVADGVRLAPIMDQFHPDTFTDPRSCDYQSKFEDLSRRPTRSEIRESYRIAGEFGINFETITFERS